jgi:hypothetical protein
MFGYRAPVSEGYLNNEFFVFTVRTITFFIAFRDDQGLNNRI